MTDASPSGTPPLIIAVLALCVSSLSAIGSIAPDVSQTTVMRFVEGAPDDVPAQGLRLR
jgi:hypothetical protein